MSKGKLVSKASEIVRYRPKPTLRISSKDFSGVKDFKVGETISFMVTAKVKSVSQGDEYGDYEDEPVDKTTRSTLQITKISEK